MVTPAPVFVEHLLWIQLYARGGGNTKNGKPWPLPTRGSQFDSEYRMNLQENFCFTTIMYEAEIVRSMDAGSWMAEAGGNTHGKASEDRRDFHWT